MFYSFAISRDRFEYFPKLDLTSGCSPAMKPSLSCISAASLRESVFTRIFATWILLFFPFLTTASGAERDYYKIPLDQLPLLGEADLGAAPYRRSLPMPRFANAPQRQPLPYVWIENDGEAYVAASEWPSTLAQVEADDLFAAIASAPGETIRGILFYPLAHPEESFARLPFEIAPGEFAASERDAFLQIKATHYERLTAGDFPGSAWFREQWRNALPSEAPEPSEGQPRRPGETELARTFALFSGGRAIAENLAFDRSLDPENPNGEPGQPVSEIRGIGIREYDWSEMLGETPVATDTLARLIPSDQHALFFHNASALSRFVREWRENGLPIFHMLQPMAVPPGLVERYEHQLGVSLSEIEESPAELGLGEIAVTGSDPYFATGTDVAILLDTSDPENLVAWFETTFQAIADREADIRFTRSNDPRPVLSLTNPDRTRSAHVAVFENTILLTNSRAQVEAVRNVEEGAQSSIAELDEYLFFRARYPKSDDAETGFLLLSDATIRRWCGPEWRIGASRRLRAAALLADQTARHLPALVAGEKPELSRSGTSEPEGLDDLSWTATGLRSERYGHRGFWTPISELKIELATSAEVRAYERWRNGYEREWQQFFDPIAIQFSLAPDRIDVDLTVMPLTASSEYRRMIELAGNMEITDGSGDPRNHSLLQAALAVDPESEPMRALTETGEMFGANFTFNPLAWMEGTVSLYFDDALFWRALEQIPDAEDFVTRNFASLPAALHIESKNSIQLALFLSGVRTLVEQSAPGMMLWETRQYNDQSYVAVSPADTGNRGAPFGRSEFTIFYAARSDALVVSLNEKVIQGSIDRFVKRREADSPSAPWLGKHLNLSLQHHGLRILESLFHDNYEARRLAIARAPIPLLNDWKMHFPKHDPVELLQTYWQLDPGKFVWNDEYKTYESPRIGSPATPRSSSAMPKLLPEFANLRLGVGFEHDGIRARGMLDRSDAETAPNGGNAPETASDADAVDTAQYAPLRVGSAWTWKEIDADTEEITLRTETVTGRVSTDNGERILLEGYSVIDGEREGEYRAWYSDTDGVRIHRTESDDFVSVMTSPEVVLPSQMYPGHTYRFESRESARFNGNPETIHELTERVLDGVETIEVEAGRFENCIRVVSETVTTYRNESSLLHQTTWFAPGVGKVKAQYTSEWGSSETELISYRIPTALPAEIKQ